MELSSATETSQRTAIIVARVLPDEKAAVLAEAARRGIHESDLVRDLVLAALPRTEREPGCLCRQPGVAISLRCPKHSIYPDVRRGMSVEDVRAIEEDTRARWAEDAADREEREP